MKNSTKKHDTRIRSDGHLGGGRNLQFSELLLHGIQNYTLEFVSWVTHRVASVL
jgi:hypothetical protein